MEWQDINNRRFSKNKNLSFRIAKEGDNPRGSNSFEHGKIINSW